MTTMTAWRKRTGLTALGAVLTVATVLGPGLVATRLGVGEAVGFATVSAADTIRSVGMLAEVPAAGVSNGLIGIHPGGRG